MTVTKTSVGVCSQFQLPVWSPFWVEVEFGSNYKIALRATWQRGFTTCCYQLAWEAIQIVWHMMVLAGDYVTVDVVRTIAFWLEPGYTILINRNWISIFTVYRCGHTLLHLLHIRWSSSSSMWRWLHPATQSQSDRRIFVQQRIDGKRFVMYTRTFSAHTICLCTDPIQTLLRVYDAGISPWPP